MIPNLRKFEVETIHSKYRDSTGFWGDVGIRKGHTAGNAILGSFNYFVARWGIRYPFRLPNVQGSEKPLWLVPMMWPINPEVLSSPCGVSPNRGTNNTVCSNGSDPHRNSFFCSSNQPKCSGLNAGPVPQKSYIHVPIPRPCEHSRIWQTMWLS